MPAAAARVSVEGRVRSFEHDRDGYRVYLERSNYSFRIPDSVVGRNPIRVGMELRLSGNSRNGWVWVDEVGWPSERGGSDEWLNGRVERINRYELRLFVRDDRGRLIEVDGRAIGEERRRHIDIGDVHRGDRISLRGRWERGLFHAFRIENVSSR